MNSTGSYYIITAVLLFILLCFSAFFSASETAFSSLNRIKLKNLAAKGDKRSAKARLVLKLLDAYDKLISAVLIGNNIVNIAASALAAALFINLLGSGGVSIATLTMTVILLIFGEISPKTIAKENPELTAIRTAPLLRFFIWIFSPLSFLTSALQKLLKKIFPVKHDRSITEDELLTFVEEARQEGGINKNEEQMIRQVIGFDDMKVSEIYTPRIDVEAVSEESTIDEIDRKFIDTGFSRLPVYKDSIDNISGIILLKDFYHKAMKGISTLPDIIKPAVFVPKSIKITRLLGTLQEKKSHMAVVVDEHGGTLGIVTIEDIIEELVGEIWDEHDIVVEPVRKKDDGSIIVLGSVNFKEMLEAATGKNSFIEDDLPNTTVANWCMETLGRLPKINEILSWKNLKISVIKIVKQRIMEVKISAVPDADGENASGSGS